MIIDQFGGCQQVLTQQFPKIQRRAKSNATRWRQVVHVLVADCNINTKIKNENKFLPLNIL